MLLFFFSRFSPFFIINCSLKSLKQKSNLKLNLNTDLNKGNNVLIVSKDILLNSKRR